MARSGNKQPDDPKKTTPDVDSYFDPYLILDARIFFLCEYSCHVDILLCFDILILTFFCVFKMSVFGHVVNECTNYN